MQKAPRMTFPRYVCGWRVKDRIDRLIFPDLSALCTHISMDAAMCKVLEVRLPWARPSETSTSHSDSRA